MSGGNQSTDCVDHRCHLGKGRQPLGDVARTRPPHVAIEGIVQVGGVTQSHQGTRDVWSPDHPGSRLEQNIVNVKGKSDRLQFRHDVAAPLQPIPLPLAEEFLETGIFERKEISQDVHLAPAGRDGKLTAADDTHALLRACGDRRRNAVERVVIGQRDRREARSLGARNDLFRSELAVRRGRVQVQIDSPAGN
jgi:hypothetical protein